MNTKFKMTANFVVEENAVDRKKAKSKKTIFIIFLFILSVLLFAVSLYNSDIISLIKLILETLLY